MQFGELAELNVTYPAFIKPPDYKSFPAVVYEAPPMVEGDVIVSEPVRILHEVRTWIRIAMPAENWREVFSAG